jgi:hypothetical protein
MTFPKPTHIVLSTIPGHKVLIVDFTDMHIYGNIYRKLTKTGFRSNKTRYSDNNFTKDRSEES